MVDLLLAIWEKKHFLPFYLFHFFQVETQKIPIELPFNRIANQIDTILISYELSSLSPKKRRRKLLSFHAFKCCLSCFVSEYPLPNYFSYFMSSERLI